MEENTTLMLQYDLETHKDYEIRIDLKRSEDSIRSFIETLKELSKGVEYSLSKDFRNYQILGLLLSGGITSSHKKQVISTIFRDFIDNGLYGRAKEKGKYAILLDFTSLNLGIVLLQTLKIGKAGYVYDYKLSEPEMDNAEGVLTKELPLIQTANIYRFVHFYLSEQNTQEILMRFFEKTYSQKFREWLHVEVESAVKHIEDLVISFLCELGNIPIKFSLPEEIFYNPRELERMGIELDERNNMILITLPSKSSSKTKKVKLKVTHIRINTVQKEFREIRTFISFMDIRKHGFDYLHSVYWTIREKDYLGNPITQEFWSPLYIEKRNEIIPISKKASIQIPINKYQFVSDDLKDKIILLSDFKGIRYDPNFLSNFILRNIADDIPIEIVHALLPLTGEEDSVLNLGPLIIYNDIELPQVTKVLYKYYISENLGGLLDDIMKLTVIHSLRLIPTFKYFIDSLFVPDNFASIDYKVEGHAIRLENDFIEYKEPTGLYNRNKWDKYIKRWSRDLQSKLSKGNTASVYLIGVEENGRDVILVNRGKLDDNAADDFFKQLQRTLEGKGISSDYLTIPARGYFIDSKRQKQEGEGHIFVFYAYKHES